jgi:hypothetical protein
VSGEEIARLTPKAEMLREWKGPEHLQSVIDRSIQFLENHTPQ